MKTINRQYTGKFSIPETEDLARQFMRELLQPYKLVVAVGLPCTGKSTAFSLYENPDGTHSVWNRENIFRMMFVGGERDEKYNSHIEKFEQAVLPSLMAKEKHQVFVDGYNRMKSGRRKTLGCMPDGIGKAALVVFDGPEDRIISRMFDANKYDMSQADIKQTVSKMKKTTVWPTMDEGFNDIFYLNTFGMEGIDYYRTYVNMRAK